MANSGMILVLLLIIAFFILFVILNNNSVPKVYKESLDEFRKSLPPSYHDYVYTIEDCSIALNSQERKIILCNGTNKEVYSRSDLWDINCVINEKTLFNIKKGGVARRIDRSWRSTLTYKRCYERSGIFIRVADSSTPRWQIKFSDINQMQKCVDNLQDFMNDTLKPAALQKTPTSLS